MAPKPSHDMLIHCDACGEDYSATYRRCPFCGERSDPRRASARNDPASSSRYIPTPPAARRPPQDEEMDDGYVFDGQDAFDDEPEEEYYTPRPKGGKRLAPKQGGGFDMPPINWPRLITFLCSLVIIVAALVIVFTFIYPQLHANRVPNPDADASASVSVEPSLAPTPTPAPPSQDPEPSAEPSEPAASAPVTSAPPSGGQRATVVNASAGLRVRSGPGTSYDIVASLVNGNNINVIAPADNGWYSITFTGSGGAVMSGYIMGDYISTVVGTGTVTTTPAPTATNPPAVSSQAPNSGTPVSGAVGTIVNADTGLRVRSGPGTSYDIVASLVNGNRVTVVAPAENGWYQISFTGSGGETLRGYIMGEYISSN